MRLHRAERFLVSSTPAVTTVTAAVAAVAEATAATAAAATTTTAAISAAAATTAAAATISAAAATTAAGFISAAATTAAVSTTTAAATVSAAAATATAAGVGALLTGTGLVDSQGASIDVLAVNGFDRGIRLADVGHGDEGETLRTAREFIHDDADLINGTEGSELGCQRGLGRFISEVSNVYFHFSVFL